MKYVVVIPAKNEELNIENTIISICSQSILPLVCVIIDDNSVDNTSAIIRPYLKKYPFIRYHKLNAINDYKLGGHVVELFNYGKKIIDQLKLEYDYIVKLDADVSFKENFFELINEKIENSHPGICSGTPYYLFKNKTFIINSPSWHSRGQFKIYNVQCLSQIGGLSKSLGWDCCDNIKAMELGWETSVFPTIHYRLHRRIGSKYSFLRERLNHGLGAYFLGYNFFYFIFRVFYNLFQPPYILGSIAMIIGYLKGFFTFKHKILSHTQRIILKKMLWTSLFKRFEICKYKTVSIL